MRPMNLWQEAMRLMLSNANPWVALASAHAKVSNGPDMVRRGGEYHGATSVRSGSAAAMGNTLPASMFRTAGRQ